MVSSNKGSELGRKGRGDFFQGSRDVKTGALVCFELWSFIN